MAPPHASHKRSRLSSGLDAEPSTETKFEAKNGTSKAAPITTSLQTFVSNAFNGVAIQDDDEIFRKVLRDDWSPEVQEDDNGTPIDFAQFEALLVNLRATITDRFLIDQSFVVVPADDSGLTGVVAHTSRFSGVEASKGKVETTIVAVLKIGLRKNGSRIIQTESLVLKSTDVE